MAITLTITDDQALEIVSQIGTCLRKVPAPAPLTTKDSFLALINQMNKGEIFSVAATAFKLNTTVNYVSSQLQSLQKSGIVKMKKRGTWEKV